MSDECPMCGGPVTTTPQKYGPPKIEAASPSALDSLNEWMQERGWAFYGVRWRAPNKISRPRGQWEAWAGRIGAKATLRGYGTTARGAVDALLPRIRAALSRSAGEQDR